MSLDGIESILSRNVLKGKKLLKVESTNLVGPGENYGGELLKLEITTEDETTKSKDIIHAVAKKIPVMEMAQEMFNVQSTFKGEMDFYDKLAPMFQDFQMENNVQDVINCFGAFYGARLNVNGSDVVDRDALILMENLHFSGYKNLDRYVGYNLEEAQILLKDLAALHAVPLAIKQRKPDFFQKEIRPLLINQFIQTEKHMFNEGGPLLEDILRESDKCVPFLPKVKKILSIYKVPPKYEPREPFATFSHGDLWVNNAMMKFEDGKPVSNKFVDFQCYDYKSPASDLLNFLLTSIQNDVLIKEFDRLLKFYHTEFIENLKKLKCDIEPFNYSKFQEELAQEAQRAFGWTSMFVTFVVFGPKEPPSEDLPDLKNVNIRDEIRKSMDPYAKQKLHIIKYKYKINLFLFHSFFSQIIDIILQKF